MSHDNVQRELEASESLRYPRPTHPDAPRELRSIRNLARLKHPSPLQNPLIRVRPGHSGPLLARRPTEIHQKRRKQVLV
jgi:hypothetical protein